MKKKLLFLPGFSCVLLICSLLSACRYNNTDSGSFDAGVESLKSGIYDMALNYFQTAVKKEEHVSESYRFQGIINFYKGEYEVAVSMFDLGLESLQHDNEEFVNDVLFYKADALSRIERWDEALSVYEQLTQGALGGEAYLREGKIYLETGDFDKAYTSFTLSCETDASIENCLAVYESYKSFNLEADGAEYLKKATLINPSDGEDYTELGKVYVYLDDYDSAYSCLTRAVEMEYPEAVLVLGSLYLEENDISGAKAIFLDELRAKRNMAMSYDGLAMCAIKEEDYETALLYVEQGLSYNDDEFTQSLLFNEIVAYEKMLDFDTAESKVKEYVYAYPEDDAMSAEYRFLSRD